MVEIGEKELLLQALTGYLEELRDTGVDELKFAELPASGPDYHGAGNARARLLFVMTGAGVAGEAGDLLTNIIKAMGFALSDVYLCRFTAQQSGAQTAQRETLLSCIAAVAPEVVVTLGEPAAQLLLGSRASVETLRGHFHDLAGIPVMPTLPPEALLADPALKREVWSDMQQVMKRLAARPR